ncbi:hypothetical protein CAC42_1565 [Sphaceloma murrayae]|uniref:Uncharacterized protein n=1 Tax=Sphaceloma murrayae TaxID=2082308 RepID=A0A2K1R345_9PEZI|nr:hypothetical protein CAC42_1565 [Sphaceloma murrayae]
MKVSIYLIAFSITKAFGGSDQDVKIARLQLQSCNDGYATTAPRTVEFRTTTSTSLDFTGVYNTTITPTVTVLPSAVTSTVVVNITPSGVTSDKSSTQEPVPFATTILDTPRSACQRTVSSYTQATLPASVIPVRPKFTPAVSALQADIRGRARWATVNPSSEALTSASYLASRDCTMLAVVDLFRANTITAPAVTSTATPVTFRVTLTTTLLGISSETVGLSTNTRSTMASCVSEEFITKTYTTSTVTPSPTALACGPENLLNQTVLVPLRIGKAIARFSYGPIVGLTIPNDVAGGAYTYGPNNAYECCRACFLDDACLGSHWLQPNVGCVLYSAGKHNLTGSQSVSIGSFYNAFDTDDGKAKTWSVSEGQSFVLSNGPAGYWGDIAQYQ